MKRSVLFPVAVLAAFSLGGRPPAAFARPNHAPPPVDLTYRGGPLIAHVKVVTLYWGSVWTQSQLPAYFNSFFTALFADGRYMTRLSEYSVSKYPIGNGTFGGTATDAQSPPTRLHDAQIQNEIGAQIAAGHLPAPDVNTVYAVVIPPGVEVFDAYGDNSVDDFYSYHDWASGNGGFPYIVMPYDDSLGTAQESMTVDLSHELAEVVTDPDPYDLDSQIGWYDDYYGEVVDIVDTLYDAGVIGESDYVAQLTANGATYLVEKFWSNKANAPVAF